MATFDWRRVEEAIADQLRHFAELLRGNVPRARQALKKLLRDKLTFTPVQLSSGRQTYAFCGTLAYGAVLQQVIGAARYTATIPDWTASV